MFTTTLPLLLCLLLQQLLLCPIQAEHVENTTNLLNNPTLIIVSEADVPDGWVQETSVVLCQTIQVGTDEILRPGETYILEGVRKSTSSATVELHDGNSCTSGTNRFTSAATGDFSNGRFQAPYAYAAQSVSIALKSSTHAWDTWTAIKLFRVLCRVDLGFTKEVATLVYGSYGIGAVLNNTLYYHNVREAAFGQNPHDGNTYAGASVEEAGISSTNNGDCNAVYQSGNRCWQYATSRNVRKLTKLEQGTDSDW